MSESSAAVLGYHALAITDENSLAGVVRMHLAAKEQGLKLLVGSLVTPIDSLPVTLYATDRASYGRLARLITQGRLRMPKGQCRLTFDDISELGDGLLCVVVPPASQATWRNGKVADEVSRYRRLFGDRAYLAAELHRGPDDEACLDALMELAHPLHIPLVAANDVHYHVPERRYLQDVLTSIREGCTVHEAGRRLFANGERHLKPPEEMATLFKACPEAIARTAELADRCHFSLDELRYEYPEELCPIGLSPLQYLTKLAWAGANKRYPGGVPPKVHRLIQRELRLIEELRYEAYFLTVRDLVRFARSRGILCQGRGSAANSAVCYCLGITALDPDRFDLLFERFVSKERNEPPDIDIDFEHERREEVFQYIYEKYGRERAGITAEVITYRPRSAIRDIGKTLGLSLDCVDRLAKTLGFWDEGSIPEDRIREAGLDPSDRTIRCLCWLTKQILGFPRHLSQHVGGFVITRSPLCEMVPIENGGMPDRTFIEWDKNDIAAVGMMKIDCLALGMLTALRKGFDLVNRSSRQRTPLTRPSELTLTTIPPEDPAVYDMLCRADSVGVFQVESRAQMSMLPRLKPREFVTVHGVSVMETRRARAGGGR